MPPTFAQLGVPKSICHALARRGITKPFEIQRAAMPDALSGRDICGHAPTGSGKTLAFGIPLVANAGKARPYRPQALVLAPTRELSHQIMTELRSLSGKIRVTVVYGGVGYGPQIGALRRGVHILVACPGRLEDLIDQRAVDLSDVEQVVVDEADRMADMGFIPAVRRLLDQTSSRRQTMLFSATLDGPVKSLIRDYQNDPARHRVSAATPDVVAADHVFWTVARTDRLKVTAETIDAAGSTIVFSRTRHGCDRIVRQLDRNGVRAAAIHGKRSQSQRTRALEDFASGKVQALVATDVVARGIHVEDVRAVIHFDLPADHKAYLHRSGRTARAGAGGIVVSLVPPDQVRDIRQIKRQLGLQQRITRVDLRAIQPLAHASPHPQSRKVVNDPASRQHRNSQQRRRSRRHTSRNKYRQRPSNHKRSPSKSQKKHATAQSN